MINGPWSNEQALVIVLGYVVKRLIGFAVIYDKQHAHLHMHKCIAINAYFPSLSIIFINIFENIAVVLTF